MNIESDDKEELKARRNVYLSWVAKIDEQISELEKPKQWEPKGGKWYISMIGAAVEDWSDPADQHVLNILTRDIEELLTQPEPFKPDWANYRQGVADSTREPLSDEEITTNTPKLIPIGERLAFHAGIRWAEAQHKIGVEQ